MSERAPDGQPTWSHRPTQEAMEHQWRIIRPREAGSIDLLSLSGDIVGANTHYWHSRTRPCTGAGCEACAANQAPRWKGYLCCQMQPTGLRVIAELTPQAVGPLDLYFRDHRSMRGVIFRLERVTRKANGRVFCRIINKHPNPEQLPEPPSLRKMLLRMWGIKTLQFPAGNQTDLLPLKRTGTDNQENIIF